MIKNEMQSYLKDKYTENPIINFLNYWMEPSEPRAKNDLDCLYFNGDLRADTIFSVWTPLKLVLDILNPDDKFYKEDKYGSDPHRFLKNIRDNIDLYLPQSEKIVEEIYFFAKLAETRANYMIWPSQGINDHRYDKHYDQMPPTLYNCFPNGCYFKYFNNEITLNEWIEREHFEMFFFSDIHSRENIKPLITNMKPNEARWLTDKNEIIEMLQNMNEILEERLRIYKQDA